MKTRSCPYTASWRWEGERAQGVHPHSTDPELTTVSARTATWSVGRPRSPAAVTSQPCLAPLGASRGTGGHTSPVVPSLPPSPKRGAWAWAWASVQMAFWPQNSCPPTHTSTSLPTALRVRRRGSHELPRSLLHCLGHTGNRRGCPYDQSRPITPKTPTLARTQPSPQPLPAPTQRLHRSPEPHIHSSERQARPLGLIHAPLRRAPGVSSAVQPGRLGESTRTPHLARVHAAPTSHAQQRHDSRRPERGGRSAGLRAYAGARSPAMSLQHRGRGQR